MARAEIDGRKRIGIWFKFDIDDVESIKRITGHRFSKGHWSVPLNLDNARQLRKIFGRRLELGNNLRRWARAEVKQERKLNRLQESSDARLHNAPDLIVQAIDGKALKELQLPKHHPFNHERPARPYQKADALFMAETNCINANDVGTGKTLESIAAIYEAELAARPILVVGKRRTLVSVWKTELERFTSYKVYASESASERNKYTGRKISGTVAVCVIADDLRVEADRRKVDIKVKKERRRQQDDPLFACKDYRGNVYRFRSKEQKNFYQTEWGVFVIDEFRDTGINNRRSLFYTSVSKLVKAQRMWFLDATPIGGKARRLWAVLNVLYPSVYSSEWNWIERYLELEEKEIYIKGGHGQKRKVRTVGDIRDEEEFYQHHRKHIIRRTSLEALPGLPEAVHIEVATPMLPQQLAQYEEFDRAHEIIVDGRRISGSIVLSQYTRLRQMANAKVSWSRDKVAYTSVSGKLNPLIDKLDEHGIRAKDYEPGARSYVGVNDRSFALAIRNALADVGLHAMLLTGKRTDSAELLHRFDSDDEEPFIIVMTTKTGGSGLNLERANSAHLLDEPWDPDVEHQFFGRGNRGGRKTALKCYTYRTPDSIQEYIAAVAGHKKLTNKTVLDFVPKIEALRRAS